MAEDKTGIRLNERVDRGTGAAQPPLDRLACHKSLWLGADTY